MDGTAERKVPGGKLVSVRVAYDKRITDCAIRGDFFLEPPEALDDLEGAVEGLPADASVERVADAVGAVDATLVGFDATDLGRVVRAAVDGTSSA
jgi:lipoate-protein ligase A